MSASLKQLRTVTIAEAAERLNVSDDQIRRWCAAGKVRYFRDEGKRATFHVIESDLIAHVQSVLRGSEPQQPEGIAGRAKLECAAVSLRRRGADISDLLPPASERRFASAR